jgi:hypothetical protein
MAMAVLQQLQQYMRCEIPGCGADPAAARAAATKH